MRPSFRRRAGEFAMLPAALLLLGIGLAEAQTASVRGFAVSAETGQPLSGTNVALLQEGELVRGIATGRDGSFLITGLAPGTYVLEASFVGYRVYRDTLALEGGRSRQVEARLAAIAEEMEEIRVEAEDRAGAAYVQAGYQRLEAADIERVPTPGLSADLAAYMSSQPGVVSLGDRGGGLYIRGGEPSQNRLYVDRIPVYQPFHMIGFYSAVPADIVRQADLYAGGYPPGYNGGLSSVIDVGARSGNMQSYQGSVTASPFISSATASGPVVPGHLSFLGSYRRSMLETGATRYVDQPLPFSFSDGFGKLYWRASPTDRLIGSGIWSADRGTLGSVPGDSAAREIRWQNAGASLRYLFIPSAISMQAEAYVAYSRLTSEMGVPADPIRFSNVENFRVGLKATFPGEVVDTEAGLTTDFVSVDTELGGLFQNVEPGAVPTLVQAGLYVAPRIKLLPGDQLTVEPGVRAQFHDVRFDPYVEPRLRISWALADQELSLAGGLFHQELIGLSDRRDVASVFTAWTGIGARQELLTEGIEHVLFGRIGEAYHGAASYRIRPADGLEIAVGGFYREYANLFVQRWSALAKFSADLQPASGRSYGGSLRLELRQGPLYGFLNYGYSSTRYVAENANFSLWYGQEQLRFRPPHDQRHQVNAVAGLQQWGFDLRVRWSAASGRPYSRPTGFDGFVYMDGFTSQFRTDGQRRVIYEEPFNAVLPSYHRLDLSLERSFALGGGAALTVQGSLINAYDRANIFYLDVFTAERQNQLPLVPSLGLELTVGD